MQGGGSAAKVQGDGGCEHIHRLRILDLLRFVDDQIRELAVAASAYQQGRSMGMDETIVFTQALHTMGMDETIVAVWRASC